MSEQRAESRAQQARSRVREAMERNNVTQRDLGVMLGWSQSRISKILSGRVELQVDDLESICEVLGLSIAETVRDYGLEFCAEMTPVEYRIVERLRQAGPTAQQAVLVLLDFNLKRVKTSKRP